MSKILTVITATYNKGDRNRASIQSILDQTYSDFDYVIVNDDSPDETRDILNEFSDPRLKIFHQKNKGFVRTIISILEQVETPYIAIQGAGDISLPERLEKQLHFLESRPEVAVVSCATYHAFAYKPNYLEEIQERKRKAFHKHKKDIEYNTVDQMIAGNIVDHGDAMFRMSAYREAGGYRAFFHYCQDRDLWLRILQKHAVVKLGRELYVKVIDPRYDIAGNPKKAEKQAMYSLFARHLARERKLSGVDLLEVSGESYFEEFVSSLNYSNKLEIATKVYRNTMRSGLREEDINTAHALIHKHVPGHFLDRAISILKLLKHIPGGAEIYRFMYYQIQKKVNLLLLRLSKLGRILSLRLTQADSL